jgi:hypothetical protein
MPQVFRGLIVDVVPEIRDATGARVMCLGVDEKKHVCKVVIAGTKDAVAAADAMLEKVCLLWTRVRVRGCKALFIH